MNVIQTFWEQTTNRINANAHPCLNKRTQKVGENMSRHERMAGAKGHVPVHAKCRNARENQRAVHAQSPTAQRRRYYRSRNPTTPNVTTRSRQRHREETTLKGRTQQNAGAALLAYYGRCHAAAAAVETRTRRQQRRQRPQTAHHAAKE